MSTPAFRLRHVICPTDFSQFAERALRHAVTIASANRSQLTVVHVAPWSAPVGGGVPPAMVQLLGPEARQKLVDRLQAFAEPARTAGLSPTTILLEGDPAREIGRLAEARSADMLVLGTHGRRGLARFVRGSVTDELLRRSPCPVLTVCHAERAEAPVERILCATDLRSPAGDEVAHAASVAAGCGAELTVLHVLEHGPGPDLGRAVGGSVRSALRWSYEQEAGRRLRTVVPDAERQRIAIRERVVAGRAHEEILRVAREEASQLIVLGTCHHGTLERLWVGSTAQRVVREAPCPVRIVRTMRSRVQQSAPAGIAASA